MRFLIVMGCLVFGASLWMSPALADGDCIESLRTGYINWTKDVVVAHEAESVEQALDNVLQTVVQVRLDANTNVFDRVRPNAQMWSQVKEMAAASKTVVHDEAPDGSARITIHMNLLGGFSQLVLPVGIKQVEPIKPLNGHHSTADEDKTTVEVAVSASQSEVYSGLIVDARGINFIPAMVPVLLDESGKEVYSSAFVSREFAVQQGVCLYLRSAKNLEDSPRVAPNPLMVKGLRTPADNRCHIVISNADASKLHGASAHLRFLKQCRVIIVVD